MNLIIKSFLISVFLWILIIEAIAIFKGAINL